MPRDFGSAFREAPDFAPAPTPLILDPKAPLRTARTFLEHSYTSEDVRTLHHHGGLFLVWTGTHYAIAEDAGIRSKVYDFLDAAERPLGEGKTAPFSPTRSKVGDVLDALAAASNLPATIRAPAWLEHAADIPAREIVACSNGLLHVPTRTLLPHSPLFFGQNAVEYANDPQAPQPAAWLSFLASIWQNDAQAVDTLQEIFGYSLTADTRQQKLFLVTGPKRSGKGTVARVLTALLGPDNVAGPTLASLGQNFGLAPLIGKQLAIIADARLGTKADQQAIAERLLSISGEDALTVDRKFLPAWTGRLPTRFVILTNELPRLADASGALASRFLVLTMTRSFFGAEDHGLTERLLSELPGIFNWALAGLDRLTARGYFVQPASSAEAIRDLEDLGSPISAFLRERCIVEPGAEVVTTTLFEEWGAWCKAQGRDHAGTIQTFGRDLRAAVPGLAVAQPRHEGSRIRFYQGVRLSRDADQQPEF
jgi:putative DNA primase/helicase